MLPSFIGYMLFLSAINCLCEEERELNLLRTLGVILTVWHVASWLASWGSIDLDGMLQVVDIIIGVVNIYFHFQLLTNLASIATKYQSADDELDAKLLRYRTLQTVIVILIVVLICKGCAGGKKDLSVLQGTWYYDQYTEYEFDGKGNGCMCIDKTNHYEFTYDIDGDTLKVDYALDYVTDCEYTYTVDGDKLTLVGGNGTAERGKVYELTKQE